MASAYKWRITNTKYAYLATPTSDVPVISGFTADEEVKIAQRVNGYSETTYSTQYNILKGIIAADPDGAKLTMLSYKYYYDIDETSCGFTNESIGPQGIQGLQGIQGIQGLQGNDGIGIDYIYTGTTASVASGFRVYIRLTNGVEYYFDVVNGQDGLPASIDYDRIVSAITALNIGEQISGATAEYLIEQLSHIYGREIVNIREILQAYSGIMSTLSADTGSVQAQVLYESGVTRQLWEYYNTQYSSITQIYQEFNAYSGLVGQMVVYVDLVSSAVTDLESGYLAVSGMLYDYITRTDALTGDMSGLTRSYNALSNSFDQTIFNITQGGDSGNPYVELSQIYQSCNTISAVTTNSDGLAAGLILCINEDTSEALITAQKLKLLGEDIKLGSIVDDAEHYHSEFFADGSGYLCNNKIHWDLDGVFTIENRAIIDDCIIKTCDIDRCEITNATIRTADITDCEVYDIVVKGSFRSPFSVVESSWQTKITDNVVMISSTNGWITNYSLPWDVSQSGRRITIVNYRWNDQIAEGWAGIDAPQGYNFYEDGVAKDTLNLSRQAVELLGYGTSTRFYGWIVLNRIDIASRHGYGHNLKWLASGTVIGTSSSASFLKYVTYDGTNLTVSREGQGVYKISWDNDTWFREDADVFAIITGYGKIWEGDNAIGADLYEKKTSHIIVYTSDDASNNDGSFMFFLSNLNDGTILLPHQ